MGRADVKADPLDLPQIAHLVACAGPTGRISLEVFVGGECVGIVPISETRERMQALALGANGLESAEPARTADGLEHPRTWRAGSQRRFAPTSYDSDRAPQSGAALSHR